MVFIKEDMQEEGYKFYSAFLLLKRFRNEGIVMKVITILLTKYSDCISNFIYHITGQGYTHVSISLEENKEVYYSFNYHGFCVETIEKHRHRGVRKSKSYQLAITNQSYQKLKEIINQFQMNKEKWSYSRLGVLCCILHIPFHWQGHYFCSQFVAEILNRSNALHLKRDASLYLPNHFCNELTECNQLIEIQQNPI